MPAVCWISCPAGPEYHIVEYAVDDLCDDAPETAATAAGVVTHQLEGCH
jgi:hypothetical protein